MANKIDSRAVIGENVKLGKNVEIGPFAVLEGDVVIGDNVKIGPHVLITGHTTIGKGTVIHVGAAIGGEPQDLHYDENVVSYTDIGENCTIREYVTIHRGTEDGSRTVVGNNVLLMAFSHLGHNCVLGNNVVVVNATLLAGRVHVEDNAFISASCLVHQFSRIGRLAMVGGGSHIGQDVPPFCMLQSGAIQGPNLVGLRRANWPVEKRDAIRNAIKIYFFRGLNRPNAIAAIREEIPSFPELEEFIEFIENTQRGIMSGRVGES